MKSVTTAHEYRSALADYPTPPVPEHPTVGLVVPVYNEFTQLEKLIADLVAQDYPEIREIWFADGRSSDGTFEALRLYEVQYPHMHVISNPRRLPASAINLAIRRIKTDILIRLDANAYYDSDAVRSSVEALLATGAGGVGAIARPVPAKTIVGRAIVAAHRSRLGVGAGSFRREGTEGWVDTVWNGCYWKHVVDRVGPFREDLWRAEDNDFNERVRRLGYGL